MGRRKIFKLGQIVEGVKAFKKLAGIEKAYLFGSYARGDAVEDSDVDLLLLSQRFEGKNYVERLKGLWLKWNLGLPADFICYTPKEFEREKKRISIAREALLEGVEI
ncbi:MAG: nucleotidyltransferase domain-containing protein [Candidatus Micrarchaeota archaeon]